MLQDLKTQATDLEKRVTSARELLDLPHKMERLAELEGSMAEPGFWNDSDRARTVSSDAASLREEIDRWEMLGEEVSDLREMIDLMLKEDDAAQVDAERETQPKLEDLKRRFEAMEGQLLFQGSHDERDAFVSIHAGAGGVDASDWSEMLLRMITRFAESKNWAVELLDQSKGAEAGIKSATLLVHGRFAYGHLKAEHGIHRLVRISPFDAEGMRHTSFASIEVTPDLGDVGEVELKDEDLRIDTFRASGAGGQHVNVTDSAVRVTHLPSGLTVSVQNERSQQQNKSKALAILKSKLAVKAEEERRVEEEKARGVYKSAEWGNQIRSYVLHPYKMVKDHRTGEESPDPDRVLNGDLDAFIEAYLRWQAAKEG